MADFEKIMVEEEGDLTIITLNKPPANSLCDKLLSELDKALDEFVASDSKAAVITGGGGMMFSAGADLNMFKSISPDDAAKVIQLGKDVFDKIELCPKPVVAAIKGACLGGGCELAMSCDVRIAVDGTRFGQPEIKLGIIPGWGGTQRMPRLIGLTKGMELLLSGDMIQAAEAAKLGLVNKVVGDSELMDVAMGMAKKLGDAAPLCVKAIKEVAHKGFDLPIAEGLKMEGEAFAAIGMSEDAKEGIDAFLNKRKPSFKGK